MRDITGRELKIGDVFFRNGLIAVVVTRVPNGVYYIPVNARRAYREYLIEALEYKKGRRILSPPGSFFKYLGEARKLPKMYDYNKNFVIMDHFGDWNEEITRIRNL